MKADLSPTGRALRALELLQAQPGLTAAQLATQLGVTERAARRYVAILREAGIPVESARGPYGGYRLGRGIRLPPLVFSAAEALGLVMAVLDGSHAAADAGDPVGAALGKIIRALPENVGRPAATIRRHARAAPDRGAARPGTEITSTLVAAVAAQRRVSIGYRSESGRRWEEEADPWAVVVRHGRWYLLCHSYRAGAVRAYRLDRIQSVTAGGGQFPAPGDVDYVDLLEQHLGTGWEFEARVVFDVPCDQAARYVRPPMGRLERTGNGERCVLIGTTSNPAMYAGEWLAAIPLPYRVEAGPELRAAVAAVAGRLTAALGAPPQGERPPAQRPAMIFGVPPGQSGRTQSTPPLIERTPVMSVELNAYLFFPGNAEQAIAFYQEVFGGQVTITRRGDIDPGSPPEQKNLVVNALLTGGDVTLRASDRQDAAPDPQTRVELSLIGTDGARLRALFDGLANGGIVRAKLERQFWGDVFGAVTDKYGIGWQVNIGAAGA